MADRCPWAVKFGVTLTTRCIRGAGHGVDAPDDHETLHEGRGLPQFEYQRIQWLPGDRREFKTTRDDKHAWEDLGSHLSAVETAEFNETMGELARDVGLPFTPLHSVEDDDGGA